jgi:hypothetical protein
MKKLLQIPDDLMGLTLEEILFLKNGNKLVKKMKKGNDIHIKAKNEGKFTASAKAAGQSVQEHAASVLNDPNATPLQKKRANFARNAAKWKHKYQYGGTTQKPQFVNNLNKRNNDINNFLTSRIRYIKDIDRASDENDNANRIINAWASTDEGQKVLYNISDAPTAEESHYWEKVLDNKIAQLLSLDKQHKLPFYLYGNK